jgi:hypothetical protein
MVAGIVLLWFVLTALSVVFVAIDIRSTPESPVLKWGFVLLTAYTGPIGAFLYVLGCREPLAGLHEQYVAARWRQALGSTMHCVAGDGLGILIGAVIGSELRLSPPGQLTLEYALGFGIGWTIFQALFMRDMAGGSYRRALRQTFIAEFLSMNALMAGMVPVMMFLMAHLPGAEFPRQATFWFTMSMALLTGSLVTYPMNWWLVANHLKHGMMTVRKAVAREPSHPHAEHAMGQKMEKMSDAEMPKPSVGAITGMAVLSIAMFVIGIGVSAIVVGHH